MKRFLNISFLLLIILPSFSQKDDSNISINKSLHYDTLLNKYMNPHFPKYTATGNQFNDDSIFDHKMRAYCKTNLPFPKLKNNGYTQQDKDIYKTNVEYWMSNYGYYFPLFVEYSKYKANRTIEDDLQSYNNAKEEWIKRNPKKYIEAQPLIELLENNIIITNNTPKELIDVKITKSLKEPTISLNKRISEYIKRTPNAKIEYIKASIPKTKQP